MDILDDKDAVPAPVARIDYRKIAEKFNTMEVGDTLRLDKVYNVTAFRRHLERRTAKGALSVHQRHGKCFVKRLSDTPMQVV